MAKHAAVLIVSSCWWAFPARLAMAFAALGHRVEAVCPDHHPLRKTSSVSACHPYRSMRPLDALMTAIERGEPDLLIPCDDRAVLHLHELHVAQQGSSSPVARLIQRSLGCPESFSATEHRSELIEIARAIGVRAPRMVRVDAIGEVPAALEQTGLPAVMKVDGTWGGLGVRFVSSPGEASDAFQSLSAAISPGRALKRWWVDRDPYSLLPAVRRTRPVVNIQSFVAGRPANTSIACWQGKVLAGLQAEVVQARGARGAATVVVMVDHPEMAEAGARLVHRLGLSGFCGFDFVIDDRTGAAHLVEMNARSTPISHLPLGWDKDLVAAVSSCLDLAPARPRSPAVTEEVIAFFPQAWLLAPENKLLQTGYHDVPWDEPALVRELMQLPWPERGLLARMLAAARNRTTGRSAPGKAMPFTALPLPGRAVD